MELAEAYLYLYLYLYLGLGYLGHCDDLFPEERSGTSWPANPG